MADHEDWSDDDMDQPYLYGDADARDLYNDMGDRLREQVEGVRDHPTLEDTAIATFGAGDRLDVGVYRMDGWTIDGVEYDGLEIKITFSRAD